MGGSGWAEFPDESCGRVDVADWFESARSAPLGLAWFVSGIDWSGEEKQKNTLRRGFLRATDNHLAIEQPDGTPFFAVG